MALMPIARQASTFTWQLQICRTSFALTGAQSVHGNVAAAFVENLTTSER